MKPEMDLEHLLQDLGADGSESESSACGLAAAMAEADPAAADERSDPFFVRRVLSVLPARVRGAGLAPARRARVLAAFYGGGLALAAIVAVIVPEAVGLWSDRAHAFAHDAGSVASESVGSNVLGMPGDGVLLVLGVFAVLVGGVLALFPVRVDTPAT